MKKISGGLKRLKRINKRMKILDHARQDVGVDGCFSQRIRKTFELRGCFIIGKGREKGRTEMEERGRRNEE